MPGPQPPVRSHAPSGSQAPSGTQAPSGAALARRTRAARVATRPSVRRTKPSAVRREELMRAGETVFLAKGIAAASIDEIAAAAEVAKGTFYLYFASKDELVGALRERSIQRLDERIQAFERRVAKGDWAGRLDAYIEGGVRGYFEQLEIHDVLFHAPHQHHAGGDTMSDNKIVADLAEFLAEGARAGAFGLESPELAAVMFFHALHGGVDYAIATERRVDQDRLIARLKAFFRRAAGAE
jgi:AcrR family transcriptional regulator